MFLPDRPTEFVPIDSSISFYVLAIPYDRTKEIDIDQDKKYTLDEIEKMDVGYLKLELVPRGIGKLLVKAPQLYYPVTPGQEIRVPLDIVNDGTRRLDNIEFDIDVPLNWTKEVEPSIVDSLDIMNFN